jgi:hypothetical protein
VSKPWFSKIKEPVLIYNHGSPKIGEFNQMTAYRSTGSPLVLSGNPH